jgi:1,4-dihydroxy-2-naphthoate octaprenyltransferase
MEPTTQALAGNAPARVAKRYFLATRPMFLTASVLPVLVGSSWGALEAGQWQWWVTLLAVLDIALVHAAVNVLNDVYDDANGTDRLNQSRIFPFTGGSRFIQNGVLSAVQMRQYAVLLLVGAVVLGALLMLIKGPGVLVFGLLGIALGILYSAPPVALASRGLGEIAVALGFGVLPVLGASWLQTGLLDYRAVLLAIPVSCWVANILLMNEVPDAEADARAGKATLVVRLGRSGSRWLYAALSLLSLGSALALWMVSALSIWGFIPMVLLTIIALWATVEIPRIETGPGQLLPAIQKTLTIHALGCVWLMLWPWL